MASYNLANIFIHREMSDVSSATEVLIPVTNDMEGEVIEVRTVLYGAIGTAPAVLTVSKNAASMGTLSITHTSSAEGDIDTLIPTSANRFLVTGDYIKILSSGASTNTIPAGISITI